MTRHVRQWATSAAIVGLIALSGTGGAAQEATPASAGHAHPAHIHLGTCDALDPNPTYVLTDVAPPAQASTADAAIPVERSVTTVEAPLDDLIGGGYAINVHQSVDDIGTYITCGSLSGALDDDGALVVGLGELNGSGHSGIAILTPSGEQTEVNVYLTEGGDGTASTTSGASHDMAAMETGAVVDMANLAYVPARLDVAVGTTVTWTNSDTAPHTVTAQDRALLQSGTLQPGEDFSQTFDAPGTIDYFCEFHANMKGAIVVS
jgi:plastocyanin